MKKLKFSVEQKLKFSSMGLFVLFGTFIITAIFLGIRIVIDDGDRILFLLFLLSCLLSFACLVGIWIVNLFINE